MSKYVIGLDFGTKSARALLVDAATGAVSARYSHEYAHGVIDACLPDGVTRLGPDWALQHPLDYTDALCVIISGVMRESGVAAEDVVGLSIDFTACTMLPVDARRKPLSSHEQFAHHPHAYAKLWKHHAASAETTRINAALEKNGAINNERYGGRISSELLLPKIMQILNEDEAVFQAADQLLEAGDWISQLLTGEKRRGMSTASYKAWWNIETGYPDTLFAALDPRLADLTKTKMAGEVCPVGGKFGSLTQEWADRLGLCAGIAVGCPVIDAHAGLPGCGITRPGRMMLIIGTSSVQAALSTRPYSGGGIMGGVKDGVIPGYYALESGLAAVGDIFEWFINNAVPASYQAEAEKTGVSLYRYLSERAEKRVPSGLLALDWWTGNKTPFVDALLSGVIVGYTLATKPEDVYRALVEATGFGTRLIMEHFEKAGIRIDEIDACGGIAEKDAFLMQIYADITGREIKVSAEPDTAALGAAMYAAAAAGSVAGGHSDIAAASVTMSRLRPETYKPNPARAAHFTTLYKHYCELSQYLGASPLMRHIREPLTLTNEETLGE
ncbi:MAG: ribulokinase [Treponema sp.]|jgi:L-ribulokinase|nr:ribulokinase [Treponema sp.]